MLSASAEPKAKESAKPVKENLDGGGRDRQDPKSGGDGEADGHPAPRRPAAPPPSGNNPRIVVSLIAAVAVAAFLGGYALGGMGGQESLSEDELRELVQDAVESSSAQEAPRPVISADDDPLLGNPNAPVTIIEFSDFQCPFCARFHQETLPLIDQEYIRKGLVNLVYRDMPLRSHANAPAAHVAAECANVQGSFWPYHDILFERQGEWKSLGPAELDAKLKEYASETGLNTSFSACIGSVDIVEEISGDIAHARSYGVTATPTFFVGNAQDGYVKIEGAKPYSEFKSIIDSMLG